MGDVGEHFGLPWGTLWSAIRELFSGLVPGRVPGWILGALGVILEGILVVFWERSGTYVGECWGMLGDARGCWGMLGNAVECCGSAGEC